LGIDQVVFAAKAWHSCCSRSLWIITSFYPFAALEKDRRMDRKPISRYLAYFMAVTTLNMGYPTPANRSVSWAGLSCGSTVSGKKNQKGERNARSKIQ